MMSAVYTKNQQGEQKPINARPAGITCLICNKELNQNTIGPHLQLHTKHYSQQRSILGGQKQTIATKKPNLFEGLNDDQSKHSDVQSFFPEQLPVQDRKRKKSSVPLIPLLGPFASDVGQGLIVENPKPDEDGHQDLISTSLSKEDEVELIYEKKINVVPVTQKIHKKEIKYYENSNSCLNFKDIEKVPEKKKIESDETDDGSSYQIIHSERDYNQSGESQDQPGVGFIPIMTHRKMHRSKLNFDTHCPSDRHGPGRKGIQQGRQGFSEDDDSGSGLIGILGCYGGKYESKKLNEGTTKRTDTSKNPKRIKFQEEDSGSESEVFPFPIPIQPNENDLQCPKCKGFYCEVCNSHIPPKYRPVKDVTSEENEQIMKWYEKRCGEGLQRLLAAPLN